MVAAVDIDPIHVLTYRRNFPGGEVLCRDASYLGGVEVVEAARTGVAALGMTWAGDIDCLAGGPSCQGFSAIGGRDPDDPRNSLVFEFARVVAEVQPRYFVLENVPGLLSPAYQAMRERLFLNAVRRRLRVERIPVGS